MQDAMKVDPNFGAKLDWEQKKRIYAYMAKHKIADVKVAEERLAKQDRKKAEAEYRESKEKNRIAQKAYRERHADDLKKARRVATALMAMRKKGNWEERRQAGTDRTSWGSKRRGVCHAYNHGKVDEVAAAMSAFLTEEELDGLVREFAEKKKKR